MAISCVDGVCNIYDALYNVKPGSFKTRYNLIGNAWHLYKNSKGTTKDYDGDVQVGDMITFSRNRLESDTKKGYPSENQHVGVVVRIENGKPIIKHYANGYKEEPIDNVTLNNAIKYKPSKITKFNVPTNIASKVNIPIRDNMTESEKQAINALNNTDFRSLMLNQEQLDDLAYSAISMTGVESKYGNSRRALFRAIAPGFANKLQQVKRWYNNTDESKDFTDFTTEKSQGYGSIKFDQTFRNIGYYDTDSLPSKERIQINNRRLKENDVENLYSIRNKIAKTVGLLGYDEKDFENVDVATIAAMAKLSDLYYNGNIPDSRQILKKYKGNTRAINEFDLYKTNYKTNIDNDFNGWKQLLFEYVNNDKRIRHKTKQNIIKYLETHTDIPLQFKAYLADQLGIKDPLTEKSLSIEEKDALRKIALRAINETNGIIGYNSEGVTPWIQKESDRLGSVGQSGTTTEDIFNALTDPYTSLQQTFGQALAYVDGNDIVLEDAYDFNNQGSILNFKHLLYKSKGDPYGMFRGSGSMTGSSPENPRKVLIRIPKDKYIVDVGMPVVETIQMDDKTYHNAKGRLKPRNRFIQQYNIIEDDAMKKYGGKLRYGWGGIMSQNNLVKDMIYNPSKYNLTPANFNWTTNGKRVSSGHPLHKAEEITDYGIYNIESNQALYDAWDDYAYLEEYDHQKLVDSTKASGHGRSGSKAQYINVELNDFARGILDNFMSQQQQTVINMQNRIDNDIIKVAQTKKPSQPIVRYGGILAKPRFDYGGYYSNYSTSRIPYVSDYSMNNPITMEDIPDSKAMYGVEAIREATLLKGAGTGASIGGSIGGLAGGIGAGILASAGTGAAAGAAGGAAAGAAGGAAAGAGAGAAAGAASTAWIPIIGPLVALVAAGIGAGIGAGVSNKKAKLAATQQLAQNKQQLAYNAELNRQSNIGNAIKRIDRDVYKMQNNQNNFNMSQGFYGKFGGIIGVPRRRYDMGGFIQPNSSDSVVAYGRTHEQMNPMTGETGVSYGNAEVEGGGLMGGIPQAGEVIRQSPMGDQVYTDSIVNPRTGLTYAKDAKKLTDQKGRLEKQLGIEQATLEKLLNDLNTSKTLGAKKGTQVRNAEKAAARMNLTTGMIADVDMKLQNLFGEQEQIASTLGLRDTNPMRYGGRVVPKFGVGGWLAPTLSFAGNTLTSGLQYWTADADAKYKQGIIDMMAARQLPKQTKDEAVLLDPEYDIRSEINDARRDFRYMARFIRDNSTNPQQTRNLLAKARLDKRQTINKLKATKKIAEKEIVNKNIANIIETRNANRRKIYEDLMNEFNWNTQIQTQRMAVKSQQTQAIQQLLRDLGQSATQAAQMYVASKQWAPGVTRDMNGNIISSDFSGMSDEQLKRNKYSKVISRGSDGNMIVAKNPFRGYNTTLANAWFEEMVSRKLFSGM